MPGICAFHTYTPSGISEQHILKALQDGDVVVLMQKHMANHFTMAALPTLGRIIAVIVMPWPQRQTMHQKQSACRHAGHSVLFTLPRFFTYQSELDVSPIKVNSQNGR